MNPMAKIVLILFLIGHVLGDFYLQSSELAINKDDSFKNLLKHSALYLLSMIFVIIPVYSFKLLKWAIVISVFHFIVDLVKAFLKRKNLTDEKNALVFSIDQIVHIIVIIVITVTIYLLSEPINYIYCIQYVLDRIPVDVLTILSWILILLIIIKPFSITIKKVLYQYKPMINEEKGGYPNAGALIGILERCIILLLLSVGQYSAIGFVLTAKSIARYDKISTDKKFQNTTY